MTEIQRWAPFDPMALMGRHPNGAFVTYADHVAAVAAARAEGRKSEWVNQEDEMRDAYEQGKRDERERIVAALEAVYRYGRDRDPSAFELEVYEFIQTAIKGDN